MCIICSFYISAKNKSKFPNTEKSLENFFEFNMQYQIKGIPRDKVIPRKNLDILLLFLFLLMCENN
jgi:hypothetical protein